MGLGSVSGSGETVTIGDAVTSGSSALWNDSCHIQSDLAGLSRTRDLDTRRFTSRGYTDLVCDTRPQKTSASIVVLASREDIIVLGLGDRSRVCMSNCDANKSFDVLFKVQLINMSGGKLHGD